MEVRKTAAHRPHRPLSVDERLRLSAALSSGPIADSVLDEVEDLIQRARMNTELILNARRSTTPAARKKLVRIAGLARQLGDAVADLDSEVRDEVENFLTLAMADDMGAYYDVRDRFVDFADQTDAAVQLHLEREQEEAPTQKDGAPRNRIARDLAFGLAPIWAEHSGRKWTANGPWGHFVGLALEFAGVEASAEGMARVVAKGLKKAAETEGRRWPPTGPSGRFVRLVVEKLHAEESDDQTA